MRGGGGAKVTGQTFNESLLQKNHNCRKHFDGDRVEKIEASSFRKSWVCKTTKYKYSLDLFAFLTEQGSNIRKKKWDCSTKGSSKTVATLNQTLIEEFIAVVFEKEELQCRKKSEIIADFWNFWTSNILLQATKPMTVYNKSLLHLQTFRLKRG